jgi:molybdate transport system substrate-binding protein
MKPHMISPWFLFAASLAGVLLAPAAHAEDIHIAVAANFAAPMKQLAADFEKETGHKLVLTMGSTGRFYAQIKNGSPFDVLLAADDETPQKLEQEGFGVAGSRFTYAIGKLVLWSPTPGFIDDKGDVLKKGGFSHLAVANPKLAPYGRAAFETMKSLGVRETLQAKLVFGENIAQTYQFAASGSAELGFVAMSQVMEDGKLKSGSAWVVPANMHVPIRQDAVLLEKGKGKEAAQAWMRYLRSEKAREVVRRFGYGV